MAFAPGEYGPPAFLTGIDVMKIQVPTRGAERGVASFLLTVGDTTVSVCDPTYFSADSFFPSHLSSPCTFFSPDS
jgi:hypothetical protein